MTEQREKAILVGVNLQNEDDFDFQYSMEELGELAAACDVEVVGQVTQKLDRVNNSHYIGKGKIEEVAALKEMQDADTVIFDDELSPSQIRNLEADLDCKVIDRTILILDIFARRAKTREAQMQVEMARLQYMLPRLVGLRASLGRQGGGGGEGLTNRGAGETKLELDRRRIEAKIAFLRKELSVHVAQREVQRRQRKKNEVPVVSLVGYTNAGKSTIMNGMIELFNESAHKQVFEKNMLFATLETSIRKIEQPDRKSYLLTDTVGFVKKLPHHLVKAFRSTLEEAANADLLIHVVDFSNPHYRQMIQTTNETLKEMDIEGVPTLIVYNKADQTGEEYPRVENDKIFISAKKKEGLKELNTEIRKHIFKDYVTCTMLIPFEEGHLVSYFNSNANVTSASYEEEGTLLKMECRLADYEKYKQYVIAK
ncbi:GTPase HflX [Bacillus testis]|uniref:GTPase HflX n=1 Tax=Bacillus testis TaxID=1622072 RepID=UPI00067E80A3|nr:GTPase HflX [Bacillus testis]